MAKRHTDERGKATPARSRMARAMRGEPERFRRLVRNIGKHDARLVAHAEGSRKLKPRPSKVSGKPNSRIEKGVLILDTPSGQVRERRYVEPVFGKGRQRDRKAYAPWFKVGGKPWLASGPKRGKRVRVRP
jgi:hypothetical protein